jgi:glutamyl-tRNA reductase
LREHLGCSLADLMPLLVSGNGQLMAKASVQELTVISTCNRMEIYAVASGDLADVQSILVEHLSRCKSIEAGDFLAHIYIFTGDEAGQHLFEVAAGLDSLVLGEAQILGQVTDAHMAAEAAGTAGPLLTALFRAAIRAGKRARTETRISSNPASISSVAIAKAQQIVGDLKLSVPLVVGMGEMGQLAMKSLQSRGVEQIAVANRTVTRAEAFAEGCGGNAYTMAELAKALAVADVVISATGAPHIIIHPEMVREAMSRRSDRQLVLVDIAVPRDVDPAVGEIPGVHLFDMDDLQESLDEALLARKQETPRVKEIIHQEMVALEEELRQVSVRPLIVGLRQKAEAIRQRELQRTLRHLGDVDQQTMEQLQHFSRSLVNKLLHDPTIRLKETADNRGPATFEEAVRQLFRLESSVESSGHES